MLETNADKFHVFYIIMFKQIVHVYIWSLWAYWLISLFDLWPVVVEVYVWEGREEGGRRRWWRTGPELSNELPIRGPSSQRVTITYNVRAVGQRTQQQVARAYWTWDWKGTEFDRQSNSRSLSFSFWTLSYSTHFYSSRHEVAGAPRVANRLREIARRGPTHTSNIRQQSTDFCSFLFSSDCGRKIVTCMYWGLPPSDMLILNDMYFF